MNFFYCNEVFFSTQKGLKIIDPRVHLTNMGIHSDGIKFWGIIKQFGPYIKNDHGFFFHLPLSRISKIYADNLALSHYVAIETYDQRNYYLAKLGRLSSRGNKKHTNRLVDILNKILSDIVFCPSCGCAVLKDSNFCDICGNEM